MPWAFYLFLNGNAESMLSELKVRTSSICNIYQPLSLVDNNSGSCGNYQYRGLICRLFGYAATRDKYGKLRLATCKIIKERKATNYKNSVVAIEKGMKIPVFTDYYMQLSQIDFNLGKDRLLAEDATLSADLAVKWLHGAPASNLRTQIDVNLKPSKTSFDGYDGYQFEDPARASYYSSPMTVFDAKVDENGVAKVTGNLDLASAPSGFMQAGFTIRAYEDGGDISADNFTMQYSPYAAYVGMKSPKGKYDKSLSLNVENEIGVVVLDEAGKPLKNQKISIGVYKVKWNWWYDSNNEISNFNTTKHLGAITTAEVTTNAKGEAIWKFAPEEWGRYLIRAANVASGHTSGIIFHAGSPWNDDNFNDKQGATMLAFSADKESYEVGDEVVLEVPTGMAGRALLTLENAFKVVEYRWIDIKNEDGVQEIKFTTKEGMAPTIYAHITLLQPHEQAANDLPIRSYGVLPIKVIDPKTKLEPVLDMADVLEPNSKVTINVSETNKQAMTYTLAIVDEGLLDLTRFKTPNLWEHFYKKEALHL